MLTVAAIPKTIPILLGTIMAGRHGPERGRRPAIKVRAYCPICRDSHSAFFPDDATEKSLDLAVVIDAPCPQGHFYGSEIALALDPCQVMINRRSLAEHQQRIRRWRVEKRFENATATELD